MLQFAPMLLVLCCSLRVVGVACVPTSACVARDLQSHSVVRLFGASDVVICIVERFGGLVQSFVGSCRDSFCLGSGLSGRVAIDSGMLGSIRCGKLEHVQALEAGCNQAAGPSEAR